MPAWVDGLKRGLPELPDAKKARFIEALGLTPYDAGVLVAEQASRRIIYETALAAAQQAARRSQEQARRRRRQSG